MATLTIASLIPERDNVDFGNGHVLEIISGAEMDAADIATFQSLHGRVMALQRNMEKADDDKMLSLAQRLNEALGKALRQLIPDLTDEILGETRLGIRMQILKWWTEQNPAPVPNPEGQEKPS